MSQYIHGTDPVEQARLARLNDLLNQSAVAELKLTGGERILDVGSGLGQLTRAMARAAVCKVVGIERSPEQLAEARRFAAAAGEEALVEFRPGEATALPLREDEWGTFDVVHTRFLLEHVPDPEAVVRGMVRAARPGGRIVLQDDPHDVMRLWPEPPGFNALWATYMWTYDQLGNDPLIGHRLVSLLCKAGVKPVRNTWLFFGACAGEEVFPDYVENLLGVLSGARELMLSQDLLNASSLDAGLTAIREWARRPDAAIWYAVSWAEGRRPS